jgi:hypothetical protein
MSHRQKRIECNTLQRCRLTDDEQVLLKNQIIRLIVFDDEREAIALWIPD